MERGKVILTVYNSAGLLIATPVNEILENGVYEMEFNGSNLSSGIYFYRIVSSGQVATRKMILVR